MRHEGGGIGMLHLRVAERGDILMARGGGHTEVKNECQKGGKGRESGVGKNSKALEHLP